MIFETSTSFLVGFFLPKRGLLSIVLKMHPYIL